MYPEEESAVFVEEVVNVVVPEVVASFDVLGIFPEEERAALFTGDKIGV
jgi:hypothetical protein